MNHLQVILKLVAFSSSQWMSLCRHHKSLTTPSLCWDDNTYKVRAGLDYNEEVHRLVKNFAHDKLIGGNNWHGGQDGGKKGKEKKKTSSWSSLEAKFLVQGFGVAQEKSVAMLATIMPFFFIHA